MQQRRERQHRELSKNSHHLAKRTALEDLLGATFAKSTVTQSKCKIEVEIDMYKKDISIPLTSCPLKWWKENAQTYPLLSSLSKAYLTIPATSVPSERVFSTAGDIVNAQRSHKTRWRCYVRLPSGPLR